MSTIWEESLSQWMYQLNFNAILNYNKIYHNNSGWKLVSAMWSKKKKEKVKNKNKSKTSDFFSCNCVYILQFWLFSELRVINYKTKSRNCEIELYNCE